MTKTLQYLILGEPKTDRNYRDRVWASLQLCPVKQGRIIKGAENQIPKMREARSLRIDLDLFMGNGSIIDLRKFQDNVWIALHGPKRLGDDHRFCGTINSRYSVEDPHCLLTIRWTPREKEE